MSRVKVHVSVWVGALVVAILAMLPAMAGAVGENAYPSSPTPSRIVLSPSETPSTSQSFAWRTDAATTVGKVEVTRPDGTPVATADSTPGPEITFPFPDETWTASYSSRHHEATVTGLSPDTAYKYRVGSASGWSSTYEFRTAAATSTPWRMLYFGDVQTDILEYSKSVMDRSFAAVPDARLSLHAGDLINDSEQDYQWGEWFEILDGHSQRMVTTTIMGNHELHGDDGARQFHQHFNNPKNGPEGYKESAYHFDYQNVRFLVLNSNKNWAPDQVDYVRSVLENNPNKWTVVSFHHPIYSASWNERDNKSVRDSWMPLFEEYNVDLVLQGHDHIYSRGHAAENQVSEGVQDGPVYVLSMAGMKQYGPPLVPTQNNYADNGGVEVTVAPFLATYQDIEFDGDYLRFNAVVAGDPVTPFPEGVDIGTSVDSFTVIKQSGKAGTSKRVVEGLHYAPKTKPSGKLKLSSAKAIGKSGRIQIKAQVTAAGKLSGTGTLKAGKRKLKVSGKFKAGKAGKVAFTLKPNKAGSRLLKRLRKRTKVAGKVTVTYTQPGKKAQRASKKVSFRR